MVTQDLGVFEIVPLDEAGDKMTMTHPFLLPGHADPRQFKDWLVVTKPDGVPFSQKDFALLQGSLKEDGGLAQAGVKGVVTLPPGCKGFRVVRRS